MTSSISNNDPKIPVNTTASHPVSPSVSSANSVNEAQALTGVGASTTSIVEQQIQQEILYQTELNNQNLQQARSSADNAASGGSGGNNRPDITSTGEARGWTKI